MGRLTTLYAGVCLVLSSSFASAFQAPTEGPGWKQTKNRNMVCEARVSGLADGQIISGTNVDVRFGSFSMSEDASSFADPWINATLVEIKGSINGTEIPNPPPPLRPQGFYGATFHSNHFSHNATVSITTTVKFHLTSLLGNETDVTVTCPPLDVQVYNYGIALGISQLEQDEDERYHGVPGAAQAMQAMQHLVTSSTGGWTDTDLTGCIRLGTAFYFNGHGNAYPALGTEQGSDWAYYDVKEIIANYLGKVPYNLVFLDACKTAPADEDNDPGDTSTNPPRPPVTVLDGLNHGFSTGGFLSDLANLNVCVNRAQLGWRIDSMFHWTNKISTTFWNKLKDGVTAHEARDAAIDALRMDPILWNPSYDIGQDPRLYIACFGDYYTRLWGVYTGNDTQASNWYLAHN